MTARVDAAVGVVADGDATWPLRLDARSGAAVVTIGEREIAVAPLRWRHKQQLARWGHLGAEFVAAQRAALAVEPGTELDDIERGLVDAVVRFLDGDALPYEPGVLAGVTIEACRATGLPPVAFDDRDAVEVELMWSVAATGATPPSPPPSARPRAAASDPWADATSIVFNEAADPPPVASPASTGAVPVAELPTVPVPVPVPAPAPGAGEREVVGDRSDIAEDNASGDGTELGSSRPPAPGGRAPTAPAVIVGPDAPGMPAGASEPDRPARSRSTPRHRISPARPALGSALTPVLPAAASVASVPLRVTEPPMHPGSARPLSASSPPSPSGSEHKRPAPPEPPSSPFRGPTIGPAVGPSQPLPTAGRPGDWPHDRDDRDAHLDELVVAVAERLADQIAAAADGLGIEV